MRLKLNDYEPNEAMRIIWESGETGYSVEMLLKIAKMYNIEIIIQKKPY